MPAPLSVIAAARRSNVPAENIRRAIERAGAKGAVAPAASLFEAYAAGGCSLVISVLSDNQNRAVAEVKNVVNNKFGKGGAKMAEPGSVTYLYERRGRVAMPAGGGWDEDGMLEAA
ncbi:hypothetical protein TeGR_g3677 [Tetraparma gracilis]|uniref:TACO1/YebC-like second and third domain-containing protein n=1 Tax=Tetraparma gracilis TaxID=2962635 RepID=A0ABQ6M5M6_9STRA|nr:hypothetical protein TeGR_g3677 [Tetraparma gracilis]